MSDAGCTEIDEVGGSFFDGEHALLGEIIRIVRSFVGRENSSS